MNIPNSKVCLEGESSIGRLGDPSIGFEKNISAAEKTFKTLAFFSHFGKDLKRENL